MHSCHLFVCSTPGKNNRPRIPVVPVELLVASGVSSADRPHHHFIRSIAGSNKGRAYAVLANAPDLRDRRWITWIDTEGRKRAAGAKNHIRSHARPIGSCCLDNPVIANMRGSDWRSDSAEVCAIEEIGVAIFA